LRTAREDIANTAPIREAENLAAGFSAVSITAVSADILVGGTSGMSIRLPSRPTAPAKDIEEWQEPGL